MEVDARKDLNESSCNHTDNGSRDSVWQSKHHKNDDAKEEQDANTSEDKREDEAKISSKQGIFVILLVHLHLN